MPRITLMPDGDSMKLSLYVLVRKLWNEHPCPGKFGIPRFPLFPLQFAKPQFTKSQPNHKNRIKADNTKAKRKIWSEGLTQRDPS